MEHFHLMFHSRCRCAIFITVCFLLIVFTVSIPFVTVEEPFEMKPTVKLNSYWSGTVGLFQQKKPGSFIGADVYNVTYHGLDSSDAQTYWHSGGVANVTIAKFGKPIEMIIKRLRNDDPNYFGCWWFMMNPLSHLNFYNNETLVFAINGSEVIKKLENRTDYWQGPIPKTRMTEPSGFVNINNITGWNRAQFLQEKYTYDRLRSASSHVFATANHYIGFKDDWTTVSTETATIPDFTKETKQEAIAAAKQGTSKDTQPNTIAARPTKSSTKDGHLPIPAKRSKSKVALLIIVGAVVGFFVVALLAGAVHYATNNIETGIEVEGFQGSPERDPSDRETRVIGEEFE